MSGVWGGGINRSCGRLRGTVGGPDPTSCFSHRIPNLRDLVNVGLYACLYGPRPQPEAKSHNFGHDELVTPTGPGP